MSIDYSALIPGQQISNQAYLVDAEAVARYVDAVDDQSRLRAVGEGHKLVPPMAIAALSLRGVVNDLAIPGGTVHVGQELDFIRPVTVGETLACKATLKQNSIRGGWRVMVVGLGVQDDKGRNVLEGQSTIMLPT